jgi:hypothetical protein
MMADKAMMPHSIKELAVLVRVHLNPWVHPALKQGDLIFQEILVCHQVDFNLRKGRIKLEMRAGQTKKYRSKKMMLNHKLWSILFKHGNFISLVSTF